MNSLKNWIIIVLTVFVLSLAGAYKIVKNNNEKLRNEKNRLELNQTRLLQENSQKDIEISLNKKEWKELFKVKGDSLKQVLHELKIKPKNVIKYVERELTYKVTAPQLIPVSFVSKNSWQIKDSTGCFVWKGVAYITNDTLKVKRTGFSFQNHEQQFLSREKKGRFLFWDTFYRNRFIITDKSDCGEGKSRTINVMK